MAPPYQARHRASPSSRKGRRKGGLNRPLASAAAVVAVAGASAAGLASVLKPDTYPPSRTTSQASLSSRAVPPRHSARASQKAPPRVSRAVVPVPTGARTALERARKASAERASREQNRRDIVTRVRSNPQAVARLLVSDQGWAARQFTCLNSLWSRESGWQWDADNPTSDAYGIPQSLPGSKMASVGSDWRTNPLTQIKWGLKYISNRYGTPCSAWSHWQGHHPHWY